MTDYNGYGSAELTINGVGLVLSGPATVKRGMKVVDGVHYSVEKKTNHSGRQAASEIRKVFSPSIEMSIQDVESGDIADLLSAESVNITLRIGHGAQSKTVIITEGFFEGESNDTNTETGEVTGFTVTGGKFTEL